jgi:hypothetical protein
MKTLQLIGDWRSCLAMVGRYREADPKINWEVSYLNYSRVDKLSSEWYYLIYTL